MGFKKSSVTMHRENYGTANPSVCVKVYNVGASIEDVVAKFACTEAQAEKALGFAFDAACRAFWEYWQDTTGDCENGLSDNAYFPGHDVTVHCEGRSGGWLIVNGLPEIDEWDAILVTCWNKFQKDVKADVDYRMGKDTLLEDIDANKWHLEGASEFNFCDVPDKGTVCLAEVVQDVRAYAKRTHGLIPMSLEV